MHRFLGLGSHDELQHALGPLVNGNTSANGVSHAVPTIQLRELWNRSFKNQACRFFKGMEAERFSIISSSNCSDADTQLCVEEVVNRILTARPASEQPECRTVYPADLVDQATDGSVAGFNFTDIKVCFPMPNPPSTTPILETNSICVPQCALNWSPRNTHDTPYVAHNIGVLLE